ncbi:MAG: TatD family hydrolase [Candidatus Saccharimonadales bacterium]
MELCDTHCHIQSIGEKSGEPVTKNLWTKAGDISPDNVIKKAKVAGVKQLVCVGCDLADSRLAIDFVQSRDGCWSSAGIHPHEASSYVSNKVARQVFAKLATARKVVAIGECGLDYHYDHSPKEAQFEILKFQIELAIQYDLPLIFHVREAFDDFWPIFESYHSSAKPIRGVLHSYTDSAANLERALRHGLFIGVNGIATFTKQIEQLEIYRTIPLENLVLETDAPFLTPSPYRGNVCEPYHILVIAEFLARLRKETVASLAEATTRGSKQLFGI